MTLIEQLREKHLDLITENLKIGELELNKEYDANVHSKISIEFTIECLKDVLDKLDNNYEIEIYVPFHKKINELKQQL